MEKLVQLGPDAITYIKEQLYQGRALSHNVLSFLDFNQSSIVTYLPPTINREAREIYHEGGKTSRKSVDEHVVALVLAHLSKRGKPYAIFEEPNARVDEPLVSSFKEPFFVYKTDIYYFSPCRGREIEEAGHLVRMTNSYPAIGILTFLPEDVPDIEDRQVVNQGILEQLTQATVALLIGAYDNESWIIWNKE